MRSPSGAIENWDTRLEYWFKLPDRYRGSIRDQYATQVVIANAGRESDTMVIGGRVSPVPADQDRTRDRLAGFAYFTRDSLLVRELDTGNARVTMLNSEFGNRDDDLFSVEAQRGDIDQRWNLYVDRNTHRVHRAEYRRENHSIRSSQLLTTMTLEHFDYEIGVPDQLFATPAQSRPLP